MRRRRRSGRSRRSAARAWRKIIRGEKVTKQRSIRMARKYSRRASKDVGRAMRRRKRGKLRRGKGGKGGKVKSRKQAIAIGLSEARKKGKKVPRKRKSRG